MAKKTAATKSKKLVYFFGSGKAEGNQKMKDYLGGKGANLAEMTNLGVPVPPGFTIATEVCGLYYQNKKKWPSGLKEQVDVNLLKLEKAMGAKLGDPRKPLLVSVRSGAAVSMPGMMDTVLNLGINTVVVNALIEKTGNPRFAWDAFRRFIQMFSDVVMEVDREHFETALAAMKEKRNVKLDTELGIEDLKALVAEFKVIYKKYTGEEFPENPKEQLIKSINAVIGSWMNDRAIAYRNMNDIKDLLGTAVNVQAMVFGNMGDTSATGVAFTRDPATGVNNFYGEFLINAQGEDVVAGIRTPQEITLAGSREYARRNGMSEADRQKNFISLEEYMPVVYKQIVQIYQKLEKHYRDMQDMEFTIQEGKLYYLQTRTGKRTAQAAVRIAVEMVKEGLIDKKTAVMRVAPSQLDQLLHKQFDPKAKKEVISMGLNASPGAAVGKVVFSADMAVAYKEKNEPCILTRIETSPEDIMGMDAAEGILTARGGATSHAAVVARGMGKCCVAGCGDLVIDYKANQMRVKDKIVREGDWISLDGTTGQVMLGKVNTMDPELSGYFGTLMGWADQIRTLKVRANADTPHDSDVARKFGAQGIGLTRTEHMFFEGDRIKAVREMILSEDVEGRRKALAKLLPIQRNDFVGIFKVMKGLPVTIRLLDPPLHEFLPTKAEDIQELSDEMSVPVRRLNELIESLHEFNPMLGHRGCRLGVTYPEIFEMQTQAIIEAALEVKKIGISVIPEIMIPLAGNVKEITYIKAYMIKKIAEVLKAAGQKLNYTIGTMIEVPRAAMTADEIAVEAEFFSFGTNDLTQMGSGFSRDDAGKFLKEYVELGIYDKDPFQVLDQGGIGRLMKTAVRLGRSVKPNMKMGICGEHGGEPASVKFCHQIGLNYVSCSPYRLPIARLAAAQAVIESESVKKKSSVRKKTSKKTVKKTVKKKATGKTVKKPVKKKTTKKKVKKGSRKKK